MFPLAVTLPRAPVGPTFPTTNIPLLRCGYVTRIADCDMQPHGCWLVTCGCGPDAKFTGTVTLYVCSLRCCGYTRWLLQFVGYPHTHVARTAITPHGRIYTFCVCSLRFVTFSPHVYRSRLRYGFPIYPLIYRLVTLTYYWLIPGLFWLVFDCHLVVGWTLHLFDVCLICGCRRCYVRVATRRDSTFTLPRTFVRPTLLTTPFTTWPLHLYLFVYAALRIFDSSLVHYVGCGRCGYACRWTPFVTY